MESRGFELICATSGDGDIPVSKYRSIKTGLHVVIAAVDGPVVNGFLCVATEAHDHDGLPHTLEHLVFMGSEDYPYKGVLDLLANRCLASGTNAWTDVDHTCYTMTTAGYEGFLNLLPIYLDHVLYPTLTDSAFITEVHHVNGKGEDAGVVYCEMQGRENTGESRCNLVLMAAMYPGDCGYNAEIGGLMKNLRESTTNEKIRSYHRAFYRPENLCVIIAGKVPPGEVFKALEPVEKKILSKGALPPFQKPWQTPVPPLTESVSKIVQFPCDDVNHGLVYMAWRGPDAKDFGKIVAMTVLMDYLTETAVAPLQREFVETADPFCSQVGYSLCENAVSCFIIYFQSVVREKLYSVKAKLMQVLHNIVTEKDQLDMTLMTTMIRRKKLNILSQMETNPHDAIAFNVIGDFLFGETVEDLRQRLNHVPVVDELFKLRQSYWIRLLKDYLINAPVVVIVGEPSQNLMQEMEREEKERVTKQRQELGEDGLKKKSEELQSAMEANEVEPPSDLLSKIPVPSAKSIHFHKIVRSNNHSQDAMNNIPQFSLEGIPYAFQLDCIHTNFITMFALLDTSKVPCNLRLYLPLLMELIMESPVKRDEEWLSYEEVVAQLTADTIQSGTSLGLEAASQFFCGNHAQVASLMLKVEEDKYSTGVSWLKHLLINSQFQPERIQVVATKLINNVAQLKRSGSKVASTILRELCFVEGSNHWAGCFIRQQKFLTNLIERLKTESDKIISDLEALRCLLTNPENVTVHVSANVAHLAVKDNPRKPWLEEFTLNSCGKYAKPSAVVPCHQLLKKHTSKNGIRNAIAGVGAVESSFLIQVVECINSFQDPDYPPLLVLIQYLTQLEGPMWRHIRGQGLSYHYSIHVKPNEGLMYFSLYKSTHLLSAYKEAKLIIERRLQGEEQWDDLLFQSSKSSLIFELIEKVKSVQDVSLQSLLCYYRDVDITYMWKLIEAVSVVKIEDLQRVGLKYLSQLFVPELSRCAICCHPSKVEEMKAGFKELSKDLTVISSIDDCFLGTLPLNS